MAQTVPPYLFEAPGDHDAPFTFTVPASLEVQPYTAHATFDGTNASGDFRPCLTFYSSDGVRLGRYFPANVVTAGDVQEVTFTPPFGTAAVSSSSGGGGITDITSIDGSVTVTNPTGPTTDLSVAAHVSQVEVLTATQIALTAGNFATPSWTHSSGATLTNLTTPTAPVPLANGNFVAEFYAAISTPPSPPGFLGELLLGQSTVFAGLVATWAGSGGSACVNSITAAAHFTTSDTFECVIFNYNSSTSQTFTNLHLYITRLP
jgi:hypothetical protein